MSAGAPLVFAKEHNGWPPNMSGYHYNSCQLTVIFTHEKL